MDRENIEEEKEEYEK